MVWHAVTGRAEPCRGAFIPFGVRAAASSAILSPKNKERLLMKIYYRIVSPEIPLSLKLCPNQKLSKNKM